ncbi:XamI family restriction endonuclease [Tautonia marina]|uniref:XamI family restriction endonuclease n=1 Tax=Tautonia marina TaxID=2653855 RepID=UPI001260ABFB|nr:XamI family restriction endonuclease [Tautonia marina]
MIDPPRWTTEEFERDRQIAISIFRRERLREPLEAYLEVFDEYQGFFEDLLEQTVDLTQLRENGLQVLTDKKLHEAFRYLAGPPISTDDLKTVAETTSLSKKGLQQDPELVNRVVELILIALDRRRFPWVADDREATEAERGAAVLASAALIATQRLGTARRHEGKSAQEQRVEDAMLGVGFKKVPTRAIPTLPLAPGLGEFCGESELGTRKADFVIRLWDHRVMPLECKVSNSALNSVKRLNNDAAVKAEVWRKDFGETQVVSTAVISGVYKLQKLEEAQRRGLTIFWAHSLNAMLDWIEKTRP